MFWQAVPAAGWLLAFGGVLLLLPGGPTAAQDDVPKPPAGARNEPAEPQTPQQTQTPQTQTPPSESAAAEPAADGPPLVAVVKLASGSFRVALETSRTPLTTANFIELVQRGFYDGLQFYQVIAGATAEAGCPINKGIAGPGYIFEDEIRQDLKHDAAGVVSMANVGPDSNGSRFAITLRPMPAMDGRNTVFGRVISGMDLVAAVRTGDVIESIRLEGPIPPFPDEVQARLKAWRAILDRHHPPKPGSPAAEAQAAQASKPPAGEPTDRNPVETGG